MPIGAGCQPVAHKVGIGIPALAEAISAEEMLAAAPHDDLRPVFYLQELPGNIAAATFPVGRGNIRVVFPVALGSPRIDTGRRRMRHPRCSNNADRAARIV